jgi:hypothetical protein
MTAFGFLMGSRKILSVCLVIALIGLEAAIAVQ